MRVISVNVGRAVPGDYPKLKKTAIDKRPIAGRAAVHENGVEGNERADVKHHSAPDHAIYAYAREDLDWWAGHLGRDLRNGLFGETLTTSGIDVNAALIGEQWRVGTTLLQITGPRMPCATFAGWMGEKGWVKRFTQAGRTGAYLQVLETGEIGAGDTIEVMGRPEVAVTVTEAIRAFHGDVGLMRRVLRVPGVGDTWRKRAEHVLRASHSPPPEGEAVRESGASHSPSTPPEGEAVSESGAS